MNKKLVIVDRTMGGLRDVLFAQIEKIINNEASLAESKEIRRTADAITNTIHVELGYYEKLGGEQGLGNLGLVGTNGS